MWRKGEKYSPEAEMLSTPLDARCGFGPARPTLLTLNNHCRFTYTAHYVSSAFKRLQILRCTMHETRGFAFSPLVLSKRTSVLPFIPVVGYCDERRGKSETGQRRPAMVRSGDSGSIARANELTPHSIQEVLRMYLQPIKHDDPQLDFYTMYKRETMEYDTEYMQKYNEDLNTTLIFVRFRVPSSVYSVDH